MTDHKWLAKLYSLGHFQRTQVVTIVHNIRVQKAKQSAVSQVALASLQMSNLMWVQLLYESYSPFALFHLKSFA